MIKTAEQLAIQVLQKVAEKEQTSLGPWLGGGAAVGALGGLGYGLQQSAPDIMGIIGHESQIPRQKELAKEVAPLLANMKRHPAFKGLSERKILRMLAQSSNPMAMDAAKLPTPFAYHNLVKAHDNLTALNRAARMSKVLRGKVMKDLVQAGLIGTGLGLGAGLLGATASGYFDRE